jgi:acetyltransferase-like isoleucine patch superfamily enzyme
MTGEPGKADLQHWFTRLTSFSPNRFHPLVWIVGEPEIGKNVYIGGMSEVNAKGARVTIGDDCDIASFVTINCADSHKKCIGISADIDRRDIAIGDHVFIGSHSVIKGGARIGHHSVIAAGSVVGPIEAAPYSLVSGNPATVRSGYYLNKKSPPA